MELQLDRVGDVAVVVVRAEFLDADNSREFRDQFPALLGQPGKVVLDLGDVQFMDSSGCGALISGLKWVREVGGDLKVCGVSGPVRALFDLVRMSRIIDVHKTRDEAVQAFGKN